MEDHQNEGTIPNPTPIVLQRDGTVYADSRDIAVFFGKRHANVLRDIRSLSCSEEFTKLNFEFRDENQTHNTGGTRVTYVEMTRDGFVFLVMGWTGAEAAKFKEAYITAFNAMEAEIRARASDIGSRLNDASFLRTLLIQHTENEIRLQGEIEEMRPQVQALERIALSDGSLCITDAAKTLQVQPKSLFQFMRSHRWIYTRQGASGDIAYQDKLASGLLEHKTTTVQRSDGSEKTVSQVRVTAKGLARLAKEFPPAVRAA